MYWNKVGILKVISKFETTIYTTCIHVKVINTCLWYIAVVVLSSVMVLGIITTTMYHMHTFVASSCMCTYLNCNR